MVIIIILTHIEVIITIISTIDIMEIINIIIIPIDIHIIIIEE
jgi:hypothetical protein